MKAADWWTIGLTAATLLFVAYDLWWVRRPRLRVRLRRFHQSERLTVTVINRGGGPITILGVFLEVSPAPDSLIGKKVQWAPGPGVLPMLVPGNGAVEWIMEAENPRRIVLEGLPFRERFFSVPEPGWSGNPHRFRRAEVFGGITKELRGQRRPGTPEKPVELR